MDPNQAGDTRNPTQAGSFTDSNAVPLQAQSGGVTSAGLAPTAADDADVIEPAWVAAVKALMLRLQSNPYELSQAMTALRKDYLQKRYGQTLEGNK